MNIIKTVGDLQKALSAYDENLPLDFRVQRSDGVDHVVLNNDTLIYKEITTTAPDVLVVTVLKL